MKFLQNSFACAAFSTATWLWFPTVVLAVPPVPRGITIQDSEVGEVVYANQDGLTLYASDTDDQTVDDHPDCNNECAELFPPLLANANDRPIGQWKTVKRSNGTTQWTFQGKALYTFSRDSKPGDAKAENWSARWVAVRYTPPLPNIPHPAGVTLQRSGREYFLSDIRGLTLYSPSKPNACTDACMLNWHPFPAPDLARPSGEWTIVSRAEGTRQWAFRSAPLYTFSQDSVAGDVSGAGVDGWEVVRIK